MAIKSTVFKAALSIADIDHNHYADLNLTLARHPSETDERMMVRLVALALNAHEVQSRCGGDAHLTFGAGLSNPDEPDVWLRDFTGATQLWIEVGQPEEKPLVRACSKSSQVLVYAYGHAAEIWWRGMESKLSRLDRLQVWRLAAGQSQALATMAQRSMQLQATVQEGGLMLSDGAQTVEVDCTRWK